MTKNEYLTIAKKIFDELDSYEKFDSKITNIGELFALKIHNGLGSMSESTPKREVIREIKENIDSKLNVHTDPDLQIFDLPIKSHIVNQIIECVFRGLQYVIETWDNVEIILLRFGMENPLEVIVTVHKIAEMPPSKERYKCMVLLIDQLVSVGGNKLINLLLWGMYDCFRTVIIEVCKNTSTEDFMSYLKAVKYGGTKFYSVYKERIVFYYYLVKKMYSEYNKWWDYIEEIGFLDKPEKYYDAIFELTKKSNESPENSEDENSDSDSEEEFTDQQIATYVDWLFIVYHFIYQKPQCIVKLAFTLMSKKVSAEVQEAIFLSFASEEYKSVIQYEYEWWCKETGCKLSLPYPFCDEPFDRYAFNNIIDYDLNKTIQNQVKNLKSDKKEEPMANRSSNEIFNHLKNHLAFVRPEDQLEKGASFKKNYFTDVCNLSSKLNDKYSTYGFACILYLSKYFDWKGIKFDAEFVNYIAEIFFVNKNLLEGLPYNYYKSKKKALHMMKKFKFLSLLLNENGMAELNKVKDSNSIKPPQNKQEV